MSLVCGNAAASFVLTCARFQYSQQTHFAAVSLSADSSFTDSTLAMHVYQDVDDIWVKANANCPGYGHRLRTKRTNEDITDSSTIQMPGLFVQALDSKGQFQDLYSFHVQDTNFAEYEMLNWYTSTCPAANHLKNIVVAQQTADGRHTFDGKEFKVFSNTQLTWSRCPESDEETYRQLHLLFELPF